MSSSVHKIPLLEVSIESTVETRGDVKIDVALPWQPLMLEIKWHGGGVDIIPVSDVFLSCRSNKSNDSFS